MGEARGHTLRLVICLFLVLAAGCSSAKVKKDAVSPLKARADRAAVRGVEAFERGDHALAQRYFSDSLAINRTLDETEGVLMALVNLGRTRLAAGDAAGAREPLGEAVDLAESAGKRAALSEALLSLAKAEYLAGEKDSALRRVEASLEVMEAEGVGAGAALNLKGYLLMNSGRYEGALTAFRRARKANAGENEAEEGNSIRGLAELALLGYNPEPPLELYSAAYEIDRRLGSPGKIALDLFGMAEALRASGELQRAAGKYERAYRVETSAGLIERAAATLETLIELYREIGDEDKAQCYAGVLEGLRKAMDVSEEDEAENTDSR